MRQTFKGPSIGALRRCSPTIGVAVVGIIASIAVWYVTATSERQAFDAEYTRRAENVANRFQSGIDDYLEKLNALRAFLESTSFVTRDEFENFAQALLNGRPGILNLAWIPRVKHEERAEHENAARREGIRDYNIRIISPDGNLPVSPVRPEYFPKYYSTENRDSRVYGLDLNDNSVRRAVINRVRDVNVLSTSPPLELHIGEGDRRGFWAIAPVYANDMPRDTAEDRRENLFGVVQGVFQIGVIADTILHGLKNPSNLYLYGPDTGPADLPLYVRTLGTGERPASLSRAEVTTGMHRALPVKFGDISWTLILAPDVTHMPTWIETLSTIMLAAGLIFTAILTLFVFAIRRNAGRLELANAQIETQNFHFDAALNNMTQGLLMFDSTGKLIISNRRITEIFDVPAGKWTGNALGKTVMQCMDMLDAITGVAITNPKQVLSELKAILDLRKPGRVVFERSNGQVCSSLCSPMSDGGFVITFSDITDRRRAEERIAHMAHYDALTDLPNRALFYQKMEQLLENGTANVPFAVLSLDLDRFKSVNDTLGHPTGDKLLQAVASRMRSCMRESDTIARLGGDEFAILQAPVLTPTEAAGLANRLIAAVSAPYRIEGHQIVVGTSVGIAKAPEDGTDPEQLMKNADLALYRCKEDSGSCYRFFDAGMGERMRERHSLEADLRSALANGEFTMNYQPVIDLASGAITGCEALIRWQHTTRGWVPPAEFIPIAEETGLIIPIGEWVLRRACADATQWPTEFKVAVNVSYEQLRMVGFVQTVTDVLNDTGLPANRLELELTETVLMQDARSALTLFKQLKSLGVSLAMDDFGTGYSSLGYLSSFPFDKIKIDRSFIKGLTEKKDCRAIIRAVVTLGRSLGIGITAEGIETQKQLDMVKAAGCTEAQGYLFGRPVTAKAINEILTAPNVKKIAAA